MLMQSELSHRGGAYPAEPDRLVKELSRAPGYVKAWKQSSLRRAATRVLALACSYYPKVVEPDTLILGKPDHHEDGSIFSQDDFKAREVSVRYFACKIFEKMDTKIWAHHYDMENKKSALVTPNAVDFGRPSKKGVGKIKLHQANAVNSCCSDSCVSSH